MALDIERLRKGVEYIETHPEQFDMRHWVAWPLGGEPGGCGTTCCLAGTIVVQEYGTGGLDRADSDQEETIEYTGWIRLVRNNKIATGKIQSEAEFLLGIDGTDYGPRLFGTDDSDTIATVDASNIRQHVERVLGVTL